MIYAIGEGEHMAHPRPFRLHVGGYPAHWEWLASFGPGCSYVVDGVDRWDYNKLVGVSVGLHHRNSFRFGWRCIGGRIELAPYVWNGGARIESRPMLAVDLGTELRLSIRLDREAAHFGVSAKGAGAQVTVVLHAKLGPLRWGYGLNPYFGGNRTAPNAMVLNVERWK